MKILKSIFIIIIFGILSYVLNRLVQKRDALRQQEPLHVKENMTSLFSSSSSSSSSPDAAAAAVATPDLRSHLSNYVIKSSFNSCLSYSYTTGWQVSTSTLENVLIRGYRMIDLELICNKVKSNIIVYVTANNKPGDTSNQSSVNTILFTDVIDSIIKIGLTNTSNSAVNWNEPLFINLRITHPKNGITTDQVYTAIESAMNTPTPKNSFKLTTFISTLANTDIKSKSLMKLSVTKQCYLIIDHTTLDSTYTSSTLSKMHGLSTGFNFAGDVILYGYDTLLNTNPTPATDPSSIVQTITPSHPPVVNSDYITISSSKLYMSIPNTPDSGYTIFNNITPYWPSVLQNFGVQFMTVNASANDATLIQYEALFPNNTGYVRMTTALAAARLLVPNASLSGLVHGVITIGWFILYVLLGVGVAFGLGILGWILYIRFLAKSSSSSLSEFNPTDMMRSMITEIISFLETFITKNK